MMDPRCAGCHHAQSEHASSMQYAWDALGACYATVSTDPSRCCPCEAFVRAASGTEG